MEQFKINGVEYNSPLEIENAKVTMTWQNNSFAELQPILDIDRLTFTGKAKNAILDFKSKNGAYLKLPISYKYGNSELFKGHLTDFNYILDRDQIEAKAILDESTDNLAELLSILDSALLSGLYEKKQIDYLVEKVDVNTDVALLSVAIFSYSYILYSQIKDASFFLARVTEATADSATLSFGATLALVIEGIAIAIFLAVTLIQILKLFNQLKNLLLPQQKKAKVISLHSLIETPIKYLGYELVTDIQELKNVFHWSSKSNIPKATDQCGKALGCFELVIQKYNAKIWIEGKKVFVMSPQNQLLQSQSTYVLGDYILENYTENTDEQKGTYELIYSTDFSDEWTLENFKGTEFLVRANITDVRNSTIKGIEQNIYSVALATRKDELNLVEKTFELVVDVVKEVLKVFGSSTNIVLPKKRLGLPKVSNANFSVPKLIYLNGDKMPKNHRDLLSAKTDWKNWHYLKSHTQNPRAKLKVYSEQQIKFNESDYQKVLKNPYFATKKGEKGRFTKTQWDYDHDFAVCDFVIEDEKRTINLKEIEHEAVR